FASIINILYPGFKVQSPAKKGPAVFRPDTDSISYKLFVLVWMLTFHPSLFSFIKSINLFYIFIRQFKVKDIHIVVLVGRCCRSSDDEYIILDIPAYDDLGR